MKMVSVVLAALAVAAASYGTYLVTSVGEEFDPRGRFGIYALIAAALSGGLAVVAWRRAR